MNNTEPRWVEPGTLGQARIKEEQSEQSHPLSSPADSPSRPPSAATLVSSTSCRSSSTTSLANTTRVRPYPSSKQGTSLSSEEFGGIMSHTPGSGTWSLPGTRSGSSRPQPTAQRRSSDNDETCYPLGHQYIPEAFVGHMHDPSDMRTVSSSSSLTSSLTGAMGNSSMPSHSRLSRSPSSRRQSSYPGNEWNSSSQLGHQQLPLGMHNSAFPSAAVLESNMTFQNMMPQDLSTNSLQFTDFNPIAHRNCSPDSASSCSSSFGQNMYNDQYTIQSTRNQPMQSRQNSSGYSVASIPSPTYHVPDQTARLEAEVELLKHKLHDLDVEYNRARSALAARGPHASSLFGGLPTPHATPPQTSPFQASWKARTDARKRIFCSLNRAGNALCAWHDSRRERRAYPPRNAPQGYLNCGCTYEEALFEESLARHSVGSYHPGETVRMDPALRNPLLKLLQQRYGYQDGDFERDPNTGDWVEGEGHSYWEQQAHSGSSARRRVDADRH